VLLVFVAVVAIRAIRRKQGPQYSLARFVAIIAVVGVGVLGGTHWRESARALMEAQREYQAASVRFKVSYETEKPAHEVTLTKLFYLGRSEVTQEQYQQVMRANRSKFKGQNLPVEHVERDDAQAFCKRASEKTGLTVRLPTEAEWEYACRSGTRTSFYTGETNADLDGAAWYGKNSGNATHPVGQKTPNAWGLYDMHGNVWEWCAEYSAEAATDPQGSVHGQYWRLRGGSRFNDSWYCRSACRAKYYPDARNVIGFRVAADVSPKAP
jgi:formylglycine-generating enzyme required for sulfatase activity